MAGLSFTDETLSIHSPPTHPIISQIDQTVIFDKFPITVPNVSYYTTSLDIFIESSAGTTGSVVKVASLTSILSSLNGFTAFMKLLQILDFLHLLNIQIPKNLDLFYLNIKGDLIDMFPNMFEQYESESECSLHVKIVNGGINCKLLNNIGSAMTVLLILLSMKLLLVLLHYSLQYAISSEDKKKNKNFFVRILEKVNSFFSLSFLLSFLISIQIDIFMGIAVTFSNLIKDSSLEAMAIFLEVPLAILYLFIFAVLVYLSIKMYKSNSKIQYSRLLKVFVSQF